MISALAGPSPWSAEFWDLFRAKYDSLAPADHAAMMAEFYPLSPVQSHFTMAAIAEFFAVHPARCVIEVGGWDGAVASAILAAHPSIAHWTNYEICRLATFQFDDPRYSAPALAESFVWDLPLATAAYDVLFASHRLEHMKAVNVRALLARLPTVTAVYVDVPLPDDAVDYRWPGYIGSHILELGWVQFEALFAEFGFAVERRLESPVFGESIRWFVRKES